MSRNNRYMPAKDGEFISWASTIFNDCSQHSSEWQLDMTLIHQFDSLLSEAKTAFDVNSNKELKNKSTVSLKNASFLALKQFLSAYTNTLEGNLSVPDEALTAMGLRPRHPHSHQPLPVPTDVPVLTAVVGQHHDVIVYASTLQHGHPTAHLKDGKYAGFLLRYKLEGSEQWQSLISTKLHHTLIFNDGDEGKHLFMQAAWVNPRMQNGPWSEEVKELVN
jgi:hypothetical protein